MPFVHASAAMGKVIADHHGRSEAAAQRHGVGIESVLNSLDKRSFSYHNHLRDLVFQAAQQGRATYIGAGDRGNATAEVHIDGVRVGQASSVMHHVREVSDGLRFSEKKLAPNPGHTISPTSPKLPPLADQAREIHANTDATRPKVPTGVVAHNPAVKAKRGDVVAFEHQSSSSYINGPNQTRTRVIIGEVTSATRDGQVKEFRDFEGGAPRKLEHAGLQHAQRYIIPGERVANKTGLEQHVRSRGVLAGSGNYRPFESIEEAHSAIKPFVTHASNVAIMRH